jgi:hypothetical protein
MFHRRQYPAPHRGLRHRHYRPRHPGAAPCAAHAAQPTTTPEQARQWASAEQAAYDAHSAAYAAWRAEPANAERQARLLATYRAWQTARLVCRQARAQVPQLFPHIRD